MPQIPLEAGLQLQPYNSKLSNMALNESHKSSEKQVTLLNDYANDDLMQKNLLNIFKIFKFQFYNSKRLVDQWAFKCPQLIQLNLKRLELSNSISFEGVLHLKVDNKLEINEGIILCGLKGLSIKSNQLIKQNANLLSKGPLVLETNYCDNSRGGIILSNQSMLLRTNKIDNRKGVICSRNGDCLWLPPSRGELDNSEGLLVAKGAIQLDGRIDKLQKPCASFLNKFGQVVSHNEVINGFVNHLNNHKGIFKAKGLILTSKSLINTAGKFFSEKDIFLELTELDPQLKDFGQRALVGKICSSEGNVYVATQCPLILASDICSDKGITIITKELMGNALVCDAEDHGQKSNKLRGIKLVAKSGEISINTTESGKEGIILQMCELESSKFALNSKGKSVTLKACTGVGALEITSQIGRICIDNCNWDGKNQSWHLSAGNEKDVGIDKAHLNNINEIDVRSLSTEGLTEKINHFSLTNSRLMAERLKISSLTCLIEKSSLDIKSSCRFYHDKWLGLKKLKIVTGIIDFIVNDKFIKCEEAILYSLGPFYMECKKGVLQFQGCARAEKGLVFLGDKNLIESSSILSSDNFAVSGNTSVVTESKIVVQGKFCILSGNNMLAERNNSIWTSNGKFLKETDNESIEIATYHSSIEQVIKARSIFAFEADTFADKHLHNYSDLIINQSCHRKSDLIRDEAATILFVKQRDQAKRIQFFVSEYFDFDDLIINAQRLELKGSIGKITNVIFVNENSKRINRNLNSLTNTSIPGLKSSKSASTNDTKSKDLMDFNLLSEISRRKDLKYNKCYFLDIEVETLDAKNLAWFSKKVNIVGHNIFLNKCLGENDLIVLNTARFLSVNEVDIKSRQYLLQSQNFVNIRQSRLRGIIGLFDNHFSTIVNSSLEADKFLSFLPNDYLQINQSDLLSDDISILVDNLEFDKVRVCALSDFLIRSKFALVSYLSLLVQQGSAHWEIDEAKIYALKGLIKSDFTSNFLSLIIANSQIQTNKNLSFQSKNIANIHSSEIKSKHLTISAPSTAIVKSILIAKDSLLIGSSITNNLLTKAFSFYKANTTAFRSLESQFVSQRVRFSAHRMTISQSSIKSTILLEISAQYADFRHSFFQGGMIGLKSRSFLAWNTSFISDQSIWINAPFQGLFKCSIQAKNLIAQLGFVMVGVNNSIKSGFLFRSPLTLNLSAFEERNIDFVAVDLSMLMGKFKGKEVAGLICELAPLSLMKWWTGQKAKAMSSVGRVVDLSQGAHMDVRFLHARGFKHLNAQGANIRVQNFGAMTSSNSPQLEGANLQGGRFVISTRKGIIQARESKWEIDKIALTAPQGIDLSKGQIQTKSLQAAANFIDHREAQMSGQEIQLVAGEKIDQRGSLFQGQLRIQSPQVLQQGATLVSTGIGSSVETSDLQTDDQTLYTGPSPLTLTFANQQLNGHIQLQSLLSINNSASQFVNNAKLVSGMLKIRATGQMRNLQDIVTKIGEISVDKELFNAALIEGVESMGVNTQHLYPQDKGRILSSQLRIHQVDALKTKDLGSVRGEECLQLSTLGPALIDEEVKAPGGFEVISQGRNENVKTLAPITARGAVVLEGKFIDVDEKIVTAQKLSLLGRSDVKMTQDVTALGGMEVEGESFKDLGAHLRVRGLFDLRVKQVTLENLYDNSFHEPAPDPRDPRFKRRFWGFLFKRNKYEISLRNWENRKNYRLNNPDLVSRAVFDVDGKFNVDAECFENLASTIRVKGLAQFKVQSWVNQSQYAKRETQWKKKPGLIELLLGLKFGGAYDPAQPRKVDLAQILIDGDLIADVRDQALNIGGVVAVSGNSNFKAKKLQNINLSHSHSYDECVGTSKKRFCGFKKRTEFHHVTKTIEVIDSAAVFDVNQKSTLNILGQLINSGVMRAGEFLGKIGNLDIDHFNNSGKAPEGVEVSTGLPFATLFSREKMYLAVENHSNISGRLQSGGDLVFSTKSLDLYRRSHEAMMPLIRKRSWSSDSVSWEKVQNHDEGGQLISGGKALVQVDGHVWKHAATVKVADDFQMQAGSLDFEEGRNLTRAELKGSRGFLQSRNQHALHTSFLPSRIDAGGRVDIDVIDQFRNSGSQISAGTGAEIISGKFSENIPMAVNCIEQTRGLTHARDRSEGVASVAMVTTREGNIQIHSRSDAHYAGIKEAEEKVHLTSEGKTTFSTFSQNVPQKDAKIRTDGLSVSRQSLHQEGLSAVQPSVTAKEIVVVAKEGVVAQGAQFVAQKTILIKTPILEWGAHEFKLVSEMNGFEFGISFPGSQTVKSVIKDEPSRKIVKDLILSDPVVGNTYQLLKAKDGEEVALCSIMCAFEGFKASNNFSLAMDKDSLKTAMGQRMGLLNDQGKLSPRITFYAQCFSQNQEVRDALSGLISAGERIDFVADQQTFTGSDITAPKMAFKGLSGKAAQVAFRSSIKEVIEERESEGASLTINPNGSVTPGVNFSEHQSHTKTNRNTNVLAKHIEWNVKNVNLWGANVHAKQHSGQIGHLDVQSQFDEEMATGYSFSADTAGNISYSPKDLDRRTIQQSTFTAELGGGHELGVKKITSLGGALNNITADEIEGRDLQEHHFESNLTYSCNIKEVQSFFNHMASRPSTSHQVIKEIPSTHLTNPIDPRAQQSIFSLGHYSRKSVTGTATVRATVAGSNNNLNLNSDWSKRRDDLKLVERNREFTLYGFDPKLMGQQAEKVFGKVKPLLSPTELFKQLDKECDEIKELEAPEAVKRALLKEKSKSDREGVDASQIILASSDGISAAEYQDGDRALEERGEPLTENEKTSVALFKKCSLLKEKLNEAKEKTSQFINYDRKIIGEDHFTNLEIALLSADQLLIMNEYHKAIGSFNRHQITIARDEMSMANTQEEKERCQIAIDHFGQKMMRANRQANKLIDQQDMHLKALRLELGHYMWENRDSSKLNDEQKREVERITKPLNQVRALLEQTQEDFTRDQYLCSRPGGEVLEREFQENPETFKQVQKAIDKLGKDLLKQRHKEIDGKKMGHLSLKNQELVATHNVLSLKLEDFSKEDLSEIAKSHETSLESVCAVIDFRTAHYPHYFRKQVDWFSEDLFKRTQPPSGLKDKVSTFVKSYTNFGEGDSSGINELSVDELKHYRTDFQRSIGGDFTPITAIERVIGIWRNGKLVVPPNEITPIVNSWSSESGMLAHMPASDRKASDVLSFFVGDGSPEELKAKWLSGMKAGFSYTPGILSTPGGTYADCDATRKKLGIPVGIACVNPSQNLAVDLAKAAHLQFKSNYLTQAGLATRQAWLSYFDINPNGLLVHWCHSNGSMHTYLALLTMPKEIANRIIVCSSGPQKLIRDGMCKKVYNYAANKDLVSSLAQLFADPNDTFSNLDIIDSRVLIDCDHTKRSGTCKAKESVIIDRVKKEIE